jgi:hypothetical protein
MEALFSYNNNLPALNQDPYPTIMDIGCFKKIIIVAIALKIVAMSINCCHQLMESAKPAIGYFSFRIFSLLLAFLM